MGLLEKAQQNEEEFLDNKRKKHRTRKYQDSQSPIEIYRIISYEKTLEQQSLLEKERQKQLLSEETSSDQSQQTQGREQQTTQTSTGIILELENKKIEIIEEQTGFGWKKQGTKRIIYDHTNHEFIFEVIEPPIKEEEIQTKNEISHLFKMLADINTFDITYEEKRKIFRRDH